MKKPTNILFSFVVLLSGVASLQAQCDHIFTHDAVAPADTPLSIGSVYTEDGITMTTTDFNDSFGLTYNLAMAKTVMPSDVFGSGLSMVLSNAAATYNVSAHSCANAV